MGIVVSLSPEIRSMNEYSILTLGLGSSNLPTQVRPNISRQLFGINWHSDVHSRLCGGDVVVRGQGRPQESIVRGHGSNKSDWRRGCHHSRDRTHGREEVDVDV